MNETAKPYELTFEEREHYLYAYVKADATSEQMAISYYSEITERCNAMQCARLLFVRDIPGMLPVGSLYFVLSDFETKITDVKIAWVNPHPANKEDFEFASGFANYALGRPRFAFFENEADAERWLLEEGAIPD